MYQTDKDIKVELTRQRPWITNYSQVVKSLEHEGENMHHVLISEQIQNIYQNTTLINCLDNRIQLCITSIINL